MFKSPPPPPPPPHFRGARGLMRFRLVPSTLALAACAVVLFAVTASAATPRELADEYCFHTNAAWCIDKDGDGTRESAPQLHPLFTEEGIEHLREKGRYYDPNDVYEPESTSTPTPTPAPTAAPAVLPTPPPGSPSAALTEDKLKRTRAKATITLDSSWSAAWYYSADTGPHANSCTAVDAGTHTVNLTGLGSGTRFIYTAYSDSNCATVLGSVAFATAVVAANNTLGTYIGGLRVTATTRKVANSFTTGAHSAGYDLRQIIGKFDQSGGTPDPIRVAIHADSSGSPGNRLWTLTNFNGSPIHTVINGAIYHFRCPIATCALQSNTTYFVVVDIPNSTKPGGTHYYNWLYTDQDGQQLTPANNGWLLGDVLLEGTPGGSTWTNNANNRAARFDVVAFPQ